MLRVERTLLVAILLLAAVLRIAACVVWSADLSRDPDAYRGLAERLAAGEGYVSPDGRPTAFRPPLYPLLLAGHLWAGRAGIAVLQVSLGVATVGLTASLGRRLGLGRWSLLAAAVVAVDPLLLRYTPQVMTEVTCASLAVLVLRLSAGPSPPATDRPSLPSYRPLLLGLAFGSAALSRPTFWAFGLLAAVAWGWHLARNDRIRSMRRAGLVLLGTLIVVTPWAVRNALVLGSPIFTTTHGGYTLLLANNPVFWGEVVNGPSGAVWKGQSLEAWQRSLEAEMAADHVPAEETARDEWMRERAKASIRQDPATFVRAVFYRLRRLWDVRPAVAGVPQVAVWAVSIFYAAVFLYAAAGVGRVLFAVWRRGRFTSPPDGAAASWLPALLLLASFTAVHAVYWTDARMRAPLVPAVALLAAQGVAAVFQPGRVGKNSPKLE